MATEKLQEYQQQVRTLEAGAIRELEALGMGKISAEAVVRLRGGVEETLKHLQEHTRALGQTLQEDPGVWKAMSRQFGAEHAQGALVKQARDDEGLTRQRGYGIHE